MSQYGDELRKCMEGATEAYNKTVDNSILEALKPPYGVMYINRSIDISKELPESVVTRHTIEEVRR